MVTGHDAAVRRFTQAVEDYRDEILDFVSDYVRRPSVNVQKLVDGDNPSGLLEAQRWLKRWLSNSGFDYVDYWEPSENCANVAVRVRGNSADRKPALLFLGHADVVPVPAPQREQWTAAGGDPWSGTREDGRIYGRGSADMKAGNAAFLWAARLVKQLGFHLERDLVLGVVCGEESSSVDDGVFSLVDRGYLPDFAVVAEPSDLLICPASMGLFFVKIVVTGKSAHISSSYETRYRCRAGSPLAVDAIEKALHVHASLAQLSSRWAREYFHPLTPPLSMNTTLASISGGAERAEISDRCELTYAVQYNPDLDGEQVIEAVRACIEKAAGQDEWLQDHHPSVSLPYMQPNLPPLNLDQAHEGVASFQESFHQALGVAARFGVFPGPCDANFLFQRGIPTVIFGPGALFMNVHGPNEYVPSQHVIDSCKVMGTFILNRCKIAG